MAKTYQEKRTNQSMKFDMTKNDIITDTREITKSHETTANNCKSIKFRI